MEKSFVSKSESNPSEYVERFSSEMINQNEKLKKKLSIKMNQEEFSDLQYINN